MTAAGILSRADAALPTGLLGLVLVLSSAVALFAPRWPVPSPAKERLLSPVMGGVSGILAALTGSFLVPPGSLRCACPPTSSSGCHGTLAARLQRHRFFAP